MDDAGLIQEFARNGTESAMAELVHRYSPMVRASAIRRVGPSDADDVVQAVFILLARKASRLHAGQQARLVGWLYNTTRLVASEVIRRRIRQEQRQMKAMEQSMPPDSGDGPWHELAPALDAAMDDLGREDREILLLRFIQDKPFAEVGHAMNLSENTATKRVERALGKLRILLGRRQVMMTNVLLASLMGSHMAQAAVSAETISRIVGGALAGGLGAGAGTGMAGPLADLAQKGMFLVKLKLATAAGLLAAAAGAAILQVMPAPCPFRLLAVESFPYVYMARSIMPDGSESFQLNTRDESRTVFVRLGQVIEGYRVARHVPKWESAGPTGMSHGIKRDVSELVLEKGNAVRVLVHGRTGPRDALQIRLIDAAGTLYPVAVGLPFECDGATYVVRAADPDSGTVQIESPGDGRLFNLKLEGAASNGL